MQVPNQTTGPLAATVAASAMTRIRCFIGPSRIAVLVMASPRPDPALAIPAASGVASAASESGSPPYMAPSIVGAAEGAFGHSITGHSSDSPGAMLIGYARRGRLTSATKGNGTTSHLTSKMFQTMAKVQFLHLPYRGSAPALQGLLAGDCDIMFDNLWSCAGAHQK
jgi:hypothetical protein